MYFCWYQEQKLHFKMKLVLQSSWYKLKYTSFSDPKKCKVLITQYRYGIFSSNRRFHIHRYNRTILIFSSNTIILIYNSEQLSLAYNILLCSYFSNIFSNFPQVGWTNTNLSIEFKNGSFFCCDQQRVFKLTVL